MYTHRAAKKLLLLYCSTGRRALRKYTYTMARRYCRQKCIQTYMHPIMHKYVCRRQYVLNYVYMLTKLHCIYEFGTVCTFKCCKWCVIALSSLPLLHMCVYLPTGPHTVIVRNPLSPTLLFCLVTNSVLLFLVFTPPHVILLHTHCHIRIQISIYLRPPAQYVAQCQIYSRPL